MTIADINNRGIAQIVGRNSSTTDPEFIESTNGAALVTQTDNGITLVDDTGTYVYIGKAASGTATSAAAWKIRRVTSASGNTYPISAEALGTWDNRASETYA